MYSSNSTTSLVAWNFCGWAGQLLSYLPLQKQSFWNLNTLWLNEIQDIDYLFFSLCLWFLQGTCCSRFSLFKDSLSTSTTLKRSTVKWEKKSRLKRAWEHETNKAAYDRAWWSFGCVEASPTAWNHILSSCWGSWAAGTDEGHVSTTP